MYFSAATHRQSLPRHRILALVAILAFVVSMPAPVVVAAETPRFPVSGYFVEEGATDAANAQKLTAIKALGGDTVITFGPQLKPATLATIPADCRVGTLNCAQVATAGIQVNRVFTYSDGSPWGAASLKCPRDGSISNNNKLFTVLVLPVQPAGCNSVDGRYDVVVVSGGSAGGVNAPASLARAATTLGMKFYAGMPRPVGRSDLPFLPDLSYQGTFSQFVGRYLQYQVAVSNVAGLAGFYLSNEMPLTGSAVFNPVLTVYGIQNRAIRAIMPTRASIVSPYIDSRIAAAGRTTPADARQGARNIALTASGVPFSIAVQDGMGTGKGGAFFGNEANAAVDPFAASIVGAGSWGSKYLAPNRDYYLAAAEGVAGTGAALWANVEGMAPATGTNACDASLRGHTTKDRLDRQLQQMANAPKKVISYKWDTYYTCVGAGTPLAQRVQAGMTTPLITDSVYDAAAGAIFVTGYNLSGATVEVKWTNAAGAVQIKTVAATTFNAAYGQQAGLNPGLQSITANVGATTLARGSYYMVNVTNAWGARNDAFYSKLG